MLLFCACIQKKKNSTLHKTIDCTVTTARCGLISQFQFAITTSLQGQPELIKTKIPSIVLKAKITMTSTRNKLNFLKTNTRWPLGCAAIRVQTLHCVHYHVYPHTYCVDVSLVVLLTSTYLLKTETLTHVQSLTFQTTSVSPVLALQQNLCTISANHLHSNE